MKQISQNIYGNMTVARLNDNKWMKCELRPVLVAAVTESSRIRAIMPGE
jgi:hypothetical protein